MSALNLRKEAEHLEDYWTPRVVARLNKQFVKVAKVKGELAWHKHDDEDEMFLVLAGSLRIEYEDRPHVDLAEGDCHVVPRGVMHNPVCEDECLIALFEPDSTEHTGDRVTEKTVPIEQQLDSCSG
ncbi:cupin domain-containing protein [Wenzhouxiangella sp. EGI_FJ10305]|uniref:cupin domain-containing protein n=1 Tax=Wenzhouxiangella sp. EGI_FJ10305 TaxID=3243768 RepID=UPI0035DEAFAD